jgi:hypothetical protein
MEEEFDFSGIVETDPKNPPPKSEEFDFSDVVDEYDFSDVIEPQNEKESSWLLTAIDYAKKAGSGLQTVGDYAAAGVGGINRGISQVVTAPLKFISAGGAFLEKLATGKESEAYSDPFGRVGQGIEDFTNKINPQIEGVNETYQNVAQGLGQGAAMLATAGVGGGANAITQTVTKVPTLAQATGGALQQLGKQVVSPTGFLGGSMTAVPEYEAAKAAGLSEEQAFEVLLSNYAVGQTEALPIQNMLGRLNRVTNNRILNTVKTMGIGGLEEATQEAVQTYLSNEVAKDNYDPDRDPLFQVLESAKVGGIVGMLLPGMVSTAQALSVEKRTKLERKIGELQADQAMESTGDPQLDAQIDAAAQIDPVDKQVLEESKVADAVQQEQTDTERSEKIQEDLQPEENTETTEEAEIKPSQTPEYKEAVSKVEELQDKFAKLPIEENADELLFELRNARQALQKIAGDPKLTKKKTPIQKQIEDATGVTKPEKSIKMTPNEAIKFRVQEFYKGVQEGVYKGKDASNELVNKVQEAIKESPLQPKQISSILSRVKKTNLFTPGSISRLNNFIDKVSLDAEYADKLDEARSINRKIRKLSKSTSGNLQNVKGLAKAFASINPEDTFITPHLNWGRQILANLSSPNTTGYGRLDAGGAQEYVNDLQEKAEQYEKEQTEKEPQGPKRNLQLFSTLKGSLDALSQKDLSDFDDSDIRTIETIKSVDPSTLTDEQAKAFVRVIDNIVENDDLSNASAIEPIVKSKQVLKGLGEKYKDTDKKEIGQVGKIFGNTYQQFTRIFGDSGIAADVQNQSGIIDVFNAGSRVENQEIKLTKDLKDKIQAVNKKYKIKVQELDNQIRLVIYSELVKNYGDDSHISKIQNNIQRTIAEYEKTDPDQAEVWKKVYEEFKDVETVGEAKLSPGLKEVWDFFNQRFTKEVNPRLAKNTIELHNQPYVEANNYTHTETKALTDLSEAQERFGEKQTGRKSKVKAKQSNTSLTATRNLKQGYGYSSDFLESQLRGYRESLYDIEASKPKALVEQTIYTPEFEEIVGGKDNADVIRKMLTKAEQIQQGIGAGNLNEAVKFANSTTQFLRNLGAVRALASLTQPLKQVPSVWTKSLFNHAGTGSLPEFFKAVRSINLISTSPNINKLFDQYTVGVRGARLGGIERGDSVNYKLTPAGKGANKIAEWLQGKSELFSRTVLKPLTNSDVYAAKTTWLSYYLQSLKEQGITKVDLNSEYLKQEDPKRKTAGAFAEQMIAETQVPSNPAALAQISRNENDGGWNFAKNILLPFSTFSINAKYRNISDVGKFLRNPNAKNAGAVAGDMAEIAMFAGISYGILNYYKDWLKEGIESLFGLEGEDDEEKTSINRKKAFYTNVINSTVPFAIGNVGEYGVDYAANYLAKIVENPDMSYEEWKKETGGFIFVDDKFDLGVYALGAEPYKEAVSGVIDLTKSKMDEPITVESFGNVKEINLTKQQENLLALKTLLELGGTLGFNEADVYNQVRKIMKEQLKSADSTPTQKSSRIRPRRRTRIRPNN